MDRSEDPDRRALVEALLAADPGDDEPLLVYADYLQHHGDPRGELIAMQTRALREPSDELARRERQLLDDHEATWLGPWHRIAGTWAFQRGFLHALTINFAKFADMARHIVALEPLSDHLVHLRELVLEDLLGGSPTVHAQVVVAIARDAPLRLTRLGLHHDLWQDTARVYAGSAQLLSSVAHLSIANAVHHPRTLDVLWSSPHLEQLTALELRDAGLTDDEAVELAEHPLYRRIRKLTVKSKMWHRRNTIELRGATALVANPHLTHLDLGGHDELDNQILHAITRTAAPLRALGLRNVQLTSAAAGLFSLLPTLESLDLRGTRLDDNGLTPILALRRLHTLNIAHTKVTADGAARILREARPALRELTIAIADLDPITAAQLTSRFVLHRWR